MVDRRQIATLLTDGYTHAERRSLLEHLSVNPDDVALAPRTGDEHAWEIVRYFERRGEFSRLAAEVVDRRPHRPVPSEDPLPPNAAGALGGDDFLGLVTIEPFAAARRLLRRNLPIVLASIAADPVPVLIRAEIPSGICVGSGALDRWTYTCDQFARRGIPGFVLTLRLIDDLQEIAFSHLLSDWSARFVQALIAGNSGDGAEGGNDGGGGNIVPYLRVFVSRESMRWGQIEKELERLERISEEARSFVRIRTQAWDQVAHIVTGKESRRRAADVMSLATSFPNAEQVGSLFRAESQLSK